MGSIQQRIIGQLDQITEVSLMHIQWHNRSGVDRLDIHTITLEHVFSLKMWAIINIDRFPTFLSESHQTLLWII